MLILNKVDLVEKAKLLALAQAANEAAKFETTFMISAAKGDGVADVRPGWRRMRRKALALSGRRSIRRAGAPARRRDHPREAVSQAAPGAALSIDRRDRKLDRAQGRLGAVEQTIYVERESQRKIVLGKAGQSIKAIGEAARRELADILEKRSTCSCS